MPSIKKHEIVSVGSGHRIVTKKTRRFSSSSRFNPGEMTYYRFIPCTLGIFIQQNAICKERYHQTLDIFDFLLFWQIVHYLSFRLLQYRIYKKGISRSGGETVKLYLLDELKKIL